MTTTNIYYPHALRSSGFNISQIRNPRLAHNFTKLVEFSAGQVGPQYAGSGQAAPDFRFESPQVKTILDLVSGGSHNVADDWTALTVDMEYRQGVLGGTRAAKASLVNLRGRMTSNSMLICERITARQGGPMEVTCRVLAFKNGANEPLIFTTAVAITGTAGASEQFTLGPLKYNIGAGNVWVESLQSVTIDNAVQLEEISDSGSEFLSYIQVARIQPVLTAVCRDFALLETFTNKGIALTGLTQYFTKRLAGKVNVADATAQHISATAASGQIKATEGADGSVTLEADMTSASEDAAPYSLNTATAIAL